MFKLKKLDLTQVLVAAAIVAVALMVAVQVWGYLKQQNMVPAWASKTVTTVTNVIPKAYQKRRQEVHASPEYAIEQPAEVDLRAPPAGRELGEEEIVWTGPGPINAYTAGAHPAAVEEGSTVPAAWEHQTDMAAPF